MRGRRGGRRSEGEKGERIESYNHFPSGEGVVKSTRFQAIMFLCTTYHGEHYLDKSS